MGTGAYDHPTFLTRQTKGFTLAAGAGGTSPLNAYPLPLRLHRITSIVRTAGTTTGAAITMYAGGTALSTTTLGTSTAGSIVTSGDLNVLVPAGVSFYFVNSADAAALPGIEVEFTIDSSATWP